MVRNRSSVPHMTTTAYSIPGWETIGRDEQVTEVLDLTPDQTVIGFDYHLSGPSYRRPRSNPWNGVLAVLLALGAVAEIALVLT
jgi:hypothetical protein